MEINIYVANLGAYNAGCLIGEWISLPLSEEELQERLDEILAAKDEDGDLYGEEWAIHDYEAPFEISEYDSPFKINEIAERLEDADIDEDVFKAICDCVSSLDEAISVVEDNEYSLYEKCSDMGDVAYEWYEQTGMMRDIPDHLQNYIDWDAVGRDMEINGNYQYAGNRTYVEVHR